MKFYKKCAVAAALVALSGAAQAALIDRGGGAIYDSTRNITWLANMNYAFTSGYVAIIPTPSGGGVSSDGKMTWQAAKDWADQLSFGGYTDWRLPTVIQTDGTCSESASVGAPTGTVNYGNNCVGGELNGLFITDLGLPNPNTPPDTPTQIANYALFSNVQLNSAYWTGTAASWDPGRAWDVSGAAYTGSDPVTTRFFAVAVRDGDVPEPPTLALALLALGATVVARKRQSR